MSSFVLASVVALVSCFLVAESIPLSSFKDVSDACAVTKKEYLALVELYGSPEKCVELVVSGMYQHIPKFKSFTNERGYHLEDMSTDSAQEYVSFIADRWLNFMNLMIRSSDPNNEDKFEARWDDNRSDEDNNGSELPSVSDKCTDEWQKLAVDKNMQPYTDAAWRKCIKFHFDYIID